MLAMRFLVLSILAALGSVSAPAQNAARNVPPAPRVDLLYPNGAPNAAGDEDRDKPSLTYYLPAKKNGTAVIVCPGGGYGALAMDHEGKQIADWLNSLGISAFVLKYRLGPRYRHPSMIQDAQRAIRMVRAQAADLGLAADRIGIWGFSAGGHLASTAATHFAEGNAQASDPVERVSSRPDFAVLAYPVISFTTEYTHRGSKRNLLGENPDEKLAASLSNELRVTPQTPPTFLFHTNEDSGVPPENSVLFYLALRKAGVPAELHIYEKGRHGVGLAPTDATLSSWPARLADWFRTRGLLR
ncbi:MAG: alpha/beta hydrolase [Bryobacterales bacterium]|nr:alpha/beta hydrolase [Bryobacterales bacterium]